MTHVDFSKITLPSFLMSQPVLTKFIEAYEETSKQFQQIGSELAKGLVKIPESIKNLAEHGWYIPMDIDPGSINYFAEELQKGNADLVDAEMISLFDNEIGAIDTYIIERFPHRKAPILAALKAHNNAEYYLSIPVFYAQIEGICRELTGFRFYKIKGKHKPATEKWVANFPTGSFTEILLAPMKDKNVTRQEQIQKKPHGLNRHDVLHGDCSDYGGNKSYSYKALSLLYYMVETVYDAYKEMTDPDETTT